MKRDVRACERRVRPSHREDPRSICLALLEVAVRLRGILERVALLDLDPYLAVADRLEQIRCARREVLALRDVGIERRSGKVQ